MADEPQPQKPPATSPSGTATVRVERKSRAWPILAVLVLLAGAGVWAWRAHNRPPALTASRGQSRNFPVPIVAGKVEKKDVPVFLDGLGTVQAFNTVTVRSRVDGQVVNIAFKEGQDVKTGDLLAEIDPAPFRAQLDQNIAKKAQDEAQLANARITLKRDEDLLKSKILSQQDYDAQKALTDQLAAGVQGDQAAINSASVNLGYTTIRAPIDGRTGIRQVDEGNIVHANDANGIVVLTQIHPISVVFTLPEQELPQIQEQRSLSGQDMTVFAMDRDNTRTLGQGTLAVIDNQIDTTTGTLRLKATFPNEDLRLWPGQFVNVRLLLTVRKGSTVVPASVVQRGPEGTFAFVVSNEVAVVRPVKVGLIEQNLAVIDEGLAPGDDVVVDGQYKLQNGQRVKLPGAREPAPNHPMRTADAKPAPTAPE